MASCGAVKLGEVYLSVISLSCGLFQSLSSSSCARPSIGDPICYLQNKLDINLPHVHCLLRLCILRYSSLLLLSCFLIYLIVEMMQQLQKNIAASKYSLPHDPKESFAERTILITGEYLAI